MIINITDVTKLEIKIGTIVEVDEVEGSDRLLHLKVDVGEDKHREIVSGIRDSYPDYKSLIGQQCPFITNLEPRKIRGIESQGMILAIEDAKMAVLLQPIKTVSPGALVR